MMVTKKCGITNSFLLVAVFFSNCTLPGLWEKRAFGRKDTREAKRMGIVTLSAEKLRAAGIETKKVSRDNAPVPLQATAGIELNGDLVLKVGSRVTGRVANILAVQGQRVKAGQVLAYIETVEVDQLWAEYLKAKARQSLAVANLQREEILFEKRVSPEKDVLRARKELKETEAELSFAKDRLRLLGVEITKLEEQKNGSGTRPLIPITSPISGAVIENGDTGRDDKSGQDSVHRG